MLDDFVRRFSEEQASGFQPFTPLKTNMLEDVSPTEIVPFWGNMLVLEGVFICTAGEVPKICLTRKNLRRSCGHSIILPCHVTTEVGGPYTFGSIIYCGASGDVSCKGNPVSNIINSTRWVLQLTRYIFSQDSFKCLQTYISHLPKLW